MTSGNDDDGILVMSFDGEDVLVMTMVMMLKVIFGDEL